MNDWLGYVPASDLLTGESSAVFVCCARGGGGNRLPSSSHQNHRRGDGSTAYYTCLLCSNSNSSNQEGASGEGDGEYPILLDQWALRPHAQDSVHKKKAEVAVKIREKVLRRAAETMRFTRDAKRFKSIDFEASIGRYVLFGPDDDDITLDDLECLRMELTLSDPLVQLELALWKVACETSPPDDVILPAQWKAFYQHGWKANKAKARSDPLMNIPALVAPFLGFKKGGGSV